MSIYDLPQFNIPRVRLPRTKSLLKLRNISRKKGFSRNQIFRILIFTVFFSSLFGFLAGVMGGGYFYYEIKESLAKWPILQKIIVREKVTDELAVGIKYIPQTTQEQAIINVVEEVSPAVVSIVVTKDLPIFEEYYASPFEGFEDFFDIMVPQYRQKGVKKQEIGGGTGFIVSEDGMILTNRHVVLDEEADYTIFTNDGKKFSARVLARDVLQDLAVIKIETEKIIDEDGQLIQKSFPVARLGDSDQLLIGQTVIAIGNALGEFRNTISVGVISGLGRTITASGGGFVETIEDVIQTDAAINKGNSGGPLLNLNGEVVGINTATVLDAQSIGFAIPINKAKRDIIQVKTLGKIVYPFLGVHYLLITETIKNENNLPVDYGVWLIKGEGGAAAIVVDSAAEEAGLIEGDIILEFNGERITSENSLAKVIVKYNPEDEITLKILRDKEEKVITAVLGEREG